MSTTPYVAGAHTSCVISLGNAGSETQLLSSPEINENKNVKHAI